MYNGSFPHHIPQVVVAGLVDYVYVFLKIGYNQIAHTFLTERTNYWCRNALKEVLLHSVLPLIRSASCFSPLSYKSQISTEIMEWNRLKQVGLKSAPFRLCKHSFYNSSCLFKIPIMFHIPCLFELTRFIASLQKPVYCCSLDLCNSLKKHHFHTLPLPSQCMFQWDRIRMN